MPGEDTWITSAAIMFTFLSPFFAYTISSYLRCGPLSIQGVRKPVGLTQIIGVRKTVQPASFRQFLQSKNRSMSQKT